MYQTIVFMWTEGNLFFNQVAHRTSIA